MKIAIILGSYSIGTRPLDFWFDNIWISGRGLTGTELCLTETAKELQKRGHDVHLFTVHAQPHNKPDSWKEVKLYNFEERLTVVDDSFDCLISINEPDVFRGMPKKPLRIVWQMLNDFPFAQPKWEEEIDLGYGVCEEHTNHLKKLTYQPEKWDTLGLGCSPDIYEDKRVPGRVIWCSSADRGLHWLLSQWPKIKKAVPYANLRIFYHFNYGNLEKIEPNSTVDHPHVIEMGQRIRYMKYAIEKLKDLDVLHVGSVSRERIAKEFSEASVFGFSCDTVAFSEGFSVSTLEAHASFTVPVITSQDCLGGIYKNSGCVMIPSPVKNHLDEYSDAVIKSLTDKEFADQRIAKCREFAKEKTWPVIAEKLEKNILKHKR